MIQIAIVEDEEIYVKQLTEYIRKYQTERGRAIKVTVFGDGEDIIENYSGGFDIILMDIQMQFMDGIKKKKKNPSDGSESNYHVYHKYDPICSTWI